MKTPTESNHDESITVTAMFAGDALQRVELLRLADQRRISVVGARAERMYAAMRDAFERGAGR